MRLQSQSICRNMSIKKSQSGLSLVELMIAITISLLILAALITIYLNLTRSNAEMAKTNSQIENGRFASQILQNDLVHAGFWGGYIPQFDDLTSRSVPALASVAGGTVPSAVPDPCVDYLPANWTNEYKANIIGIPVQAYDDVPAGCTALITDRQPDTDVLVVRFAETCLPGMANCDPLISGMLYFQTTQCATEAATPYVLDTTGFTLHKRDCATVSDIRKFISNIYWIRNYAATPGDGIPTLVRSQFGLGGSPVSLGHHTSTVTPLIEGIENFKVELGVDNLSDSGAPVDYTTAIVWANPAILTSPTNRGDGIVDGAFIRCTTAAPCTAAQLVNVVAVKFYLLARSKEPTLGYTDNKTYNLGGTTFTPTANLNFKRHVFSTFVRLTNVAGRRETP